MGINKIDYQGRTLIDLTGDTVTSDTLSVGITAHDRHGDIIAGTAAEKIIIPKTITTNGSYDAEDDNADGYSPLTVAVDLEHVTSFDPLIFTFAETDFNGWTPSSTAKAILPTQIVGTFVATDIDNNDYFVRQRVYSHLVYQEGTSVAKGMFQLDCAENWNCLTRRASTAAMLNAGTRNQNVNESVATTYLNKYYNNGWVCIYSSAYGIYPSNTAQTLSSTSATSPTVTVKTPVINAKCQATYFSTAMAGNVDQDASTIKFVVDVYRANVGYHRSPILESLMDMWRNGL